MITFEPCIRSLRSDGYAVVYIRIIKDTKPTYIKTSYIVSKKQISGKKIKDFSIIGEISPIIKKYIDKLNKVDTENWDIKEVVEFLLKDKEEISFSDFLQIFVNRMINSGRENPTKNYTTAHNSLQKFTGKTNLLFSDITSKTINEWIKSLSGTNRAKAAIQVISQQFLKPDNLSSMIMTVILFALQTNHLCGLKSPDQTKARKKQYRQIF
jgi:hypothetical protein